MIGTSYSGWFAAPPNGLLVEGNVGIGKTTVSHAIDVVGTAGLSSGVAWTNTSDKRVKKRYPTHNQCARHIGEATTKEISLYLSLYR